MFPPRIFSTLKDQSEFVYHYTRAATAIDWILSTGRIKLGAYATTNDPKEVKQWTFSLANVPPSEGYIKIDAVSIPLSAAIKRQAHIFCSSIDTGLVEGPGYEIHCRGFARPRMWDQYGDKHKGLCLVFRSSRLDELFVEQHADKDVFSGRVIYQDRSPYNDLRWPSPYLIDYLRFKASGPDRYVRDHLHLHRKHFFFEKATDWRDEHEQRWLVLDECAAEVFLSYKDALVGVAFGEDCSPADVQACVRLARRPGTDFAQLRWKNSAPLLEPRDDWADL